MRPGKAFLEPRLRSSTLTSFTSLLCSLQPLQDPGAKSSKFSRRVFANEPSPAPFILYQLFFFFLSRWEDHQTPETAIRTRLQRSRVIRRTAVPGAWSASRGSGPHRGVPALGGLRLLPIHGLGGPPTFSPLTQRRKRKKEVLAPHPDSSLLPQPPWTATAAGNAASSHLPGLNPETHPSC